MPEFNNPPWKTNESPRTQKTLLKSTEEASEFIKVLSRIGMQGLDGVDPATGEVNRDCLQKEMSDVIAQIEMIEQEFGVVIDYTRVDRKKENQRRWLNDMNVEGSPNAN